MSAKLKYPMLTREFLLLEFEEGRKTAKEIGDGIGVGRTTILNKLKKFGISRRRKGGDKIDDLTGLRFGSLTVNRLFGTTGKRPLWEATCDCGTVKSYQSDNLKLGHTTSCGCKNKATSSRNWNWKGHGEISSMFWTRCQKNASNCGREFSLTIEWAWNLFLLQGRRCALSGVILQFSTSARGQNSGTTTASLDRIDSNLPYVEDNVQWIHKSINRMKSDIPESIFVEMCMRVSQHHDLEEPIHP